MLRKYLFRAVEQELSDANEQLSEAVVSNQAITAAKRKMEQELSTLQVGLTKYNKWVSNFMFMYVVGRNGRNGT